MILKDSNTVKAELTAFLLLLTLNFIHNLQRNLIHLPCVSFFGYGSNGRFRAEEIKSNVCCPSFVPILIDVTKSQHMTCSKGKHRLLFIS